MTSLTRFCLMLAAATAMGTPLSAAELNDYPTAARADYVFACMKTNGETRQALDQCSCSIDIIASILPYDRYVAAETVLSLSQVPGRFGAMFRSPEQARNGHQRSQARPGRSRGALLLIVIRGCYISDAWNGHSPLNVRLSVSTTSTRNACVPLGT